MAYLLDVHLLAQVILYFFSVIAGIGALISIASTKTDLAFNGAFRKICSVPLGLCSSAVIVSILFGILHVKAMTMRDPNTGANMRTGLYTSVNLVVISLVVGSAILVKSGFSKFCENIADNPDGFSCNFNDYESLLVAEVACAVFIMVLLVQIVLGVARVYREPPRSPEIRETL